MEELPILCEDKIEHIVSVSLTRSGSNTTAVIHDLTETKRLQQEIERQEKLSAMGELAAGVAHEIRNPLNAIGMIAQRYEKEFKPVRGIKEYKKITTVLLEETRRVNHIIHQFLSFARPPKLRLSEISAERLVTHVATLFKGQPASKGVNFKSKCDNDAIIRADKEQLTQALLNLLQNALDATSKGGTILLNTEVKEKYVVFQVKDDGEGIPQDRINRIFDLYFTTKHKGTGMGLAITHQIITQHSGIIGVQSKMGGGTTFTIQIPRS
jgi:signal transduction histidine kinase